MAQNVCLVGVRVQVKLQVDIITKAGNANSYVVRPYVQVINNVLDESLDDGPVLVLDTSRGVDQEDDVFLGAGVIHWRWNWRNDVWSACCSGHLPDDSFQIPELTNLEHVLG